jgi:uncharacterized hydrophobic protein (TIGR00271 family)
MGEHNPKKLKEIIHEAFSVSEDTASADEIRTRLKDGGKVTGTNLCMMTCANIIACVGLNAGSMVTCIGAMLLEPLMGTILLISLCMVTADKQGIKTSSLGVLFQIAACLIASTLYFIITPVREPTEEMLAFAQPTMFEVIVAFVGGIAGIIGQTRKDKVNTIVPGVAIATALMLPLCTCGYAIAHLDERMIVGSLYMFIVNFYFIILGSFLVLNLFNLPKKEEMTEKEWKRSRTIMILNSLIVIIPAILFSLYRLLH